MGTWIKFTDNAGGPYYINMDQVYKIDSNVSTLSLTVTDTNSIVATTYSFSTLAEYLEFVKKIEVALSILDIDTLAPQG